MVGRPGDNGLLFRFKGDSGPVQLRPRGPGGPLGPLPLGNYEDLTRHRVSTHSFYERYWADLEGKPDKKKSGLEVFRTSCCWLFFIVFSKVRLQLQRKLSLHISQTFLPSTMFVFISWLSLSIPPDLFPARMALAVTPLLPLVTMANRAQTAAPATAYMKVLGLPFDLHHSCDL